MKKFVAVISLAALLITFMSLPVFAMDVVSNVYFQESYIRDRSSDQWINSTSWSSWDRSTGLLKVVRSSDPTASQYVYNGLKATWSLAPLMKVEPGYYLKLDFQFYDSFTPGSSLEFNEFEYRINIVLSDGSIHDLVPYYVDYQDMVNGNTRWIVRFGAQFGGDQTLNISYVTFLSSLPSAGTGTSAYYLYTDWDLSTEMTLDMKNHQELITTITGATQDIIDNADENTQEILDKSDENTQEILDKSDENTEEIVGAIGDQTEELTNGWETDQDPAADLDNVVDDLGNAESEALGGKSDEEIQEEVSAALDSSNFPPPSASGSLAVSSMFDDLLQAFGGKYQSLLILALTLGLAAFLVGRSYRAKGD